MIALRVLIVLGSGALCGCAGTGRTDVLGDVDLSCVRGFMDWQKALCKLPPEQRTEKLAALRDRYFVAIDCDVVNANRAK